MEQLVSLLMEVLVGLITTTLAAHMVIRATVELQVSTQAQLALALVLLVKAHSLVPIQVVMEIHWVVLQPLKAASMVPHLANQCLAAQPRAPPRRLVPLVMAVWDLHISVVTVPLLSTP